MCEHQKRADLLDAGGYFFDYYYGTYVNRKLKAILSHEFTDSLSTGELETCIAAIGAQPEWQFFCLRPPLQAAREELEAAYTRR